MKKLFNYKTLMTLLASIVVLLQVFITVFKVNIKIEAFVSISIALVGVMVALGIVKKDKNTETIENKEDLLELLEETNSDETKEPTEETLKGNFEETKEVLEESQENLETNIEKLEK